MPVAGAAAAAAASRGSDRGETAAGSGGGRRGAALAALAAGAATSPRGPLFGLVASAGVAIGGRAPPMRQPSPAAAWRTLSLGLKIQSAAVARPSV